ncbi:hypothetical protein JCM3775_004692 [Rhodotorula graminis]|uniref:Peptidase S1 domain-containing protein n=1 Tax=Rhodotorula graminis (strain WP1) TaxID=578459 RepID=A0A0P9IVJ9_RHOGW|nr:uncharacterized protein RHOBADRAFT_54912 [Rhodotorula graminis WP1]KPV73722.1 hypothetical protein RHOBADRAFT_54912 [Rhodotorula graminis WP1]
MHARTATTTRLLHTTARTHARLLNPSTSISPDHGRATAPPPPAPVWKPSSARAPRPPPAPTHKGPLRPDPEAQALLDRIGSSPPPPRRVAPAPPSPAPAQRADDLERAATLDTFLLRTLAQLSQRGAAASTGVDLHTLLRQHREREGTVLSDATLSYEPTPGPSRRVRLDGRAGSASGGGGSGVVDEQDGTVVVAHVLGGKEPRVSVCSGFALGKSAGGEGQLILTAAHTLESLQKSLHATDPVVPSATFVLASSGHVWTCSSLASSSSSADVLLLRLSTSPINASSSAPTPPLRTLPINPYPPPPSSEVALHTYINPLSRLRRKLAREPERAWTRGRIAEYKDGMGRTAEVGTYDELAAMWLDCHPTEGSSGGPVVDCESGSVVGVTRGSTHAHGERGAYGFATPAERIFELFRLPGFKTLAEREADKVKQAAQASPSPSPSASRGGQEGQAK